MKERLSPTYGEAEVLEALEEIQYLIDAEELLTTDQYHDYVVDFKRKTVVKALCLHIAHDCNLACQYCFAEEGEYHGRRALMSFRGGKEGAGFPDCEFREPQKLRGGLLPEASL